MAISISLTCYIKPCVRFDNFAPVYGLYWLIFNIILFKFFSQLDNFRHIEQIIKQYIFLIINLWNSENIILYFLSICYWSKKGCEEPRENYVFLFEAFFHGEGSAHKWLQRNLSNFNPLAPVRFKTQALSTE